MDLDKLDTIAVLGTGTMAPGIAQLCAQAGYQVNMWARTDASLQRGFDRLKAGLRTFLDHELITPGDEEQVLARVRGVTGLEEAVTRAGFVIESVAEDLALKQDLFCRLDQACAPEAILATNTSGLSIAALASATQRPDRVVATHFWNPPPLVPLVEVCGCAMTEPGVIEATIQLMRRLGRSPVLLQKEAPGFIGNRLQVALLREALHIVEQGIASMEDVDTAVKMSFGRRLAATGPLESADLGGLDVFLAISEYLNSDLCSSRQPSPLLAEAVEQGRLGAKTGKGLYDRSPDAFRQLAREREAQLVAFLRQDKAKGGA